MTENRAPLAHLHADETDGRLEWDHDLSADVLPLLTGDGWALTSDGPGTYTLARTFSDGSNVLVCPMWRDDADGARVQWLAGRHDVNGEPVGEQVWGPAVTAPPLEVAAFAEVCAAPPAGLTS